MTMQSIKHLQATRLSLPRWCLACASGELLGLGGAFALLAVARALGADGFDGATPPLLRATLGLTVGALEGGVLGAMQALALKGALQRLPVMRFAAMTALPAAMVWAAVLTLMPFGGGDQPSAEPPLALVTLAGALGGLSGGVLIGASQAAALAPVVGWRRARLWIAASATGWAAGLAVIMAATSLPNEHTPPHWVGALVAIGAALGGGALGLGSHWGARRLAPADAGEA